MANNNNTKNLNVPPLRFPEFTKEWEMASLQDIAAVNPKSNPLQNSFVYIDLEAVEKGELRKIQEVMREEAPSRAQRVIYKNDILFQCVRPYQKNNYIHKIQSKSNQQWVASTGYAQIRTTEIPNYIYHLLNTDGFNRKVMVRCTGSSYPAINSEDLATIRFYLTTDTKEQLKISRLLDLLDERIATQSKIIEDLKKLKCAIIEKVLNGNNANNLRLGDVGSYIRGLTYSSDDVVEYNSTLVMRSNNIVNGSLLDYQNNVVSVNKQISQEQQLQDGDIIICMANGSSALVGKSSFYDGKCISPITVGAFCGIYRSKTAIAKWLFQTNRYRRYIWNSLQGGNGAIANLNSEDILRMSFPLPDKQTAERCIKLLSSLESLIESNISLCSKFSQQKEYLLRQMFI